MTKVTKWMKVTARSIDIVQSFADEEEISIIVLPPVTPDLVCSVQLHSISSVLLYEVKLLKKKYNDAISVIESAEENDWCSDGSTSY